MPALRRTKGLTSALGTMETFKLQNHSPKVLCSWEPLEEE